MLNLLQHTRTKKGPNTAGGDSVVIPQCDTFVYIKGKQVLVESAVRLF
jgi:hypothetical protein